MTLVANIATAASKANDALKLKAADAIEITGHPYDWTSSEVWARFANELAKLEGAAYAYNELRHACGAATEIEKSYLSEVALELLSKGADDGWSGRTNDVRRARFDGIRTACASVRWL